MSWWKWVVVSWVGSCVVLLMAIYIMNWWHQHLIGRHGGQMSDFKQYKRSAIAEMAEWTPGFDMTNVSVSEADYENGSPKHGDMIARNPENHSDRWLVAAAYFAANFEALGNDRPL